MKFLTLISVTCLFHTLSYSQDFSYDVDSPKRKEISQKAWNDLKPVTPKSKQFLIGLLLTSDQGFKSYEEIVNALGWPPNNMVSAQSVLEIVAEEIIRDKDFTEAEIKEKYQEVQGRIGNELELNNQQRQEKYDRILVKALWLGGLAEMIGSNTPELVSLAENALNGKAVNTTPKVNTTKTETTSVAIVDKPTPKTQSINNLAEIEDIVLRVTHGYGLSGMYSINKVYVLYKNGDLLTNPSDALDVFDIKASKRNPKTSWDKWTKQGGKIVAIDSKTNERTEWGKYFKLSAAPKGFKLNGAFKTSDPFGGAVVMNASNVVFDNNGRFSWTKVTGSGDTGWLANFSKSKTAGYYEIEGHKITLKYNNGTIEESFFGLYPDKNNYFIIRSSHFLPVKK